MADEWLLKASELEAQLQQTRKRADELESFVESVANLTKSADGYKVASVSTEKIDTLVDWIKNAK